MARHLAQRACLLLLAVCLAGCTRSPSGSSKQPAADQLGGGANSPADPSSAAVGSAPETRGQVRRVDQFLSLMHAGKNYLDQGDATNALVLYKKAQAIAPNDADLRLNLANT
ncbi:MAG: tetratricopeptide repeat protein, partial [Verrucomicrobiales bacterium]|nr:tetratricopeptide repeat protein [Verrucomicrobiales bacterium]